MVVLKDLKLCTTTNYTNFNNHIFYYVKSRVMKKFFDGSKIIKLLVVITMVGV